MDINSKYFREEVLRFREFMGLKSFWSEPERASKAMYGLFYVYSKVKDLSKDDEILMSAIAEEYDRRLFYVLMR